MLISVASSEASVYCHARKKSWLLCWVNSFQQTASRFLAHVQTGMYIECMPRHHQPATQTFASVPISPLIQTKLTTWSSEYTKGVVGPEFLISSHILCFRGFRNPPSFHIWYVIPTYVFYFSEINIFVNYLCTVCTIKHKRLDCDVAEWLKIRNIGGKKSAMPRIEPSTHTNLENLN